MPTLLLGVFLEYRLYPLICMQAMWAPSLIPLLAGSNLALDLALLSLYLYEGAVDPILILQHTVTALFLVLAVSLYAEEWVPSFLVLLTVAVAGPFFAEEVGRILIPLRSSSNITPDLELYWYAGEVSPILIPQQTVTALSLV